MPSKTVGRARSAAAVKGEGGPRRVLAPGGGTGKNTAYFGPDQTPADIAGTAASIFDPVLCELVYRWFCPEGGAILDPFAGEATKGIVASVLGHPYLGIEFRKEQVEANLGQVTGYDPQPRWMVGDSANLARLVGKEKFDLVFTSPPYYDLEVYSATDASAMPTYKEFMAFYRLVFKQAAERLRDERFLVVKVGEIRDAKTGFYRNFVGDNVSLFMDLGLKYYNEMVLVTVAGSLPIRAAQHFQVQRKIGKTHQNVLVFWKGDNTKRIQEIFGNVEVPSEFFDAGIPGAEANPGGSH